jgi:hypothetical protein
MCFLGSSAGLLKETYPRQIEEEDEKWIVPPRGTTKTA